MSQIESRDIILVAEPDDNLRLSLVLYLMEQGYEVLSMADGTTALKTINEQSVPNLIVVEYELPDMSPYEFCRVIRSTPNTVWIPIICLIQKQILEERYNRLGTKELGADDYISKPPDFELLLSHIHRIFEWRRRREQRQNSDC